MDQNQDNFRPGYLKLWKENQLTTLMESAYRELENCRLCPHECGVNRRKGEKGVCQTGEKARVASAFPHIGEEAVLVGRKGSGTIFFSHCNLLCIFCQNYDISHLGQGRTLSAADLGDIMIKLQKQGCHNINLVTPSHVIPQCIAGVHTAVQDGLNVPIVYNSGGYDSVNGLKMLDGFIDIYMPDLKFSDNATAGKYTIAKDYFSVMCEALKEMYAQVGPLQVDERNIAKKGMIVRHLILPNALAGSKAIFQLIKQTAPGAAVNVMPQYYPAYKSFDQPELSKAPTYAELNQARKMAKEMGLNFLSR